MTATSEDPGAGAENNGCLPVLPALLGSSTIASLLITAGFWAGFAWVFFPMIWVITLTFAVIVGLPLYLIALATNRVSAGIAAAAGFAAGAALPVIGLLPSLGDAPAITVGFIIPFGAGGAGAGLIFFLILRGSLLEPGQRKRVTGWAIAANTIALAASWFAQDHSCHNPVWYGQGIAPSASFTIAVPQERWREVADEVDRFARDQSWSIRSRAAYQPKHDWFETSVCRADGTDIVVTRYPDHPDFEAYVYQPQGGESWRTPMRDLHARMRARWPGAVAYRDDLGEPTKTPPDWLAPKAPPAAPK